MRANFSSSLEVSDVEGGGGGVVTGGAGVAGVAGVAGGAGGAGGCAYMPLYAEYTTGEDMGMGMGI